MNNYKVGDILVDNDTKEEHKILEVFNNLVAIDEEKGIGGFSWWKKEDVDKYFTPVKSKWKPEMEEEYSYLDEKKVTKSGNIGMEKRPKIIVSPSVMFSR